MGIPVGRDRGAWRVATAATILVAGMISAGCSAGASPPPSPVPADFAAKAIVACQHARDLKTAQGPFPFPDFNPTAPDPARLGDVATVLRKTDATFRAWQTDMKALGTPSTGQSAWAALLAAIDRHVSLNADQIESAGRGDGATFARDYDAGVKTQADLLRAATDAGVPSCAAVDR